MKGGPSAAPLPAIKDCQQVRPRPLQTIPSRAGPGTRFRCNWPKLATDKNRTSSTFLRRSLETRLWPAATFFSSCESYTFAAGVMQPTYSSLGEERSTSWSICSNLLVFRTSMPDLVNFSECKSSRLRSRGVQTGCHLGLHCFNFDSRLAWASRSCKPFCVAQSSCLGTHFVFFLWFP